MQIALDQAVRHRTRALEAEGLRRKRARTGDQQQPPRLKLTMETALESDESCIGLTGFNRSTITGILGIVRVSLTPRSGTTVGRKSLFNAENALLLFLYSVVNNISPKICSAIFGPTKQICSRVFLETGAILSNHAEVFLKHCLENYIENPLTFLIESLGTNCSASIDVTFIPHAPPARMSFDQQKNYWSEKHREYGFKALIAIDASGRCIFLSRMFLGSVSDIDLARDQTSLDALSVIATKGPLLCDKGFIGLDALVPSICPRRLCGGEIESDIDTEIISARVLVENYFGRLKRIFTFFSNPKRTPPDCLEKIFKTCVWFTNIHVGEMPLRRASVEV